MQPDETIRKVGIIGAGPAGLATLAAILEEAKRNPKKHFDINIFDKRDGKYERRQIIVLSNDPTDNKGLRWDQFCKEIFYPNDVMSVNSKGKLLCNDEPVALPLNARQKLLRRILHQQNTTASLPHISIRSLELALREHIEANHLENVKVDWHWKADININLLSQKIILNNTSEDFEFNDLVVCDGAHREMTNKIRDSLKDMNMETFNFNEMGKNKYLPTTKEYYPHHFTARLVQTKKKTEEISRNDLIDDMKNLGWIPEDYKNTFPLPFHHSDDNRWKKDDPDWKLRLFITAEIPPKIMAIENINERMKAIVEYLKIFTALKYQIPKDCFELDVKGNPNLNFTTFTLNIESVDHPVRKLPNGGNVILVGDSAMTGFQNTGFSSGIALNEARKTAECLINGDDFTSLFKVYKNYQDYLSHFINQTFHQSIHEKRYQYPFFKTIKDIEFLQTHIKKYPEKYTLPVYGYDQTLDLKEFIKKLDKLAQNGDDFATYTLATQLEDGIKHSELVMGAIKEVSKIDLSRSLTYWMLLKARGFPVETHIKKLEEKINQSEQKNEIKRPWE